MTHSSQPSPPALAASGSALSPRQSSPFLQSELQQPADPVAEQALSNRLSAGRMEHQASSFDHTTQDPEAAELPDRED